MNQKQIKAAVEAMLFAAGDPVSTDKLAAAVQLPQTTVETALEELRVRYAREDSGLCLLHLDTRWQLATRTEWADCIRRLLDSRKCDFIKIIAKIENREGLQLLGEGFFLPSFFFIQQSLPVPKTDVLLPTMLQTLLRILLP